MKVFEMILDGMNQHVKAAMFSFLAFPMMIALSAMIMQVNIGSLIHKWLDLELKEKELQMAYSRTLKPSEKGLSAAELAWRKEIEDWICSHKKEPDEVPDFCKEVVNHKVVTDDHFVVYPAPIAEAP